MFDETLLVYSRKFYL